jgi:hypothetical protein
MLPLGSVRHRYPSIGISIVAIGKLWQPDLHGAHHVADDSFR